MARSTRSLRHKRKETKPEDKEEPNEEPDKGGVPQVVIGESYAKQVAKIAPKSFDAGAGAEEPDHSEELDQQEQFETTQEKINALIDLERKELAEPLVDPQTGEMRQRKEKLPVKKERKFCQLCHKSFCSPFMLKEHMKVAHENVKDHFCDKCDYKTARRSCLLLHIRKIHDRWKPYKCSEENCEFTAYHLYQVNAHINLVHKKVKPFACEYDKCVYSSVSQTGLNLHVKRVHNKVKSLKCELCDYKTDKNYILKEHINSKHLNVKPFKCAECDYAAATKAVVTSHFKRTHLGITQTRKINHKCNFCDYSTGNKPHLRNHINHVHLNLKLFRCGICNFECAAKGSMKRHVIIHSGQKDLACPHCDYRTARKVHLTEHVANVHVKSMDFNCDSCQYRTSTNQRLQKHKRISHGKKRKSSARIGEEQNGQIEVQIELEQQQEEVLQQQQEEVLQQHQEEVLQQHQEEVLQQQQEEVLQQVELQQQLLDTQSAISNLENGLDPQNSLIMASETDLINASIIILKDI